MFSTRILLNFTFFLINLCVLIIALVHSIKQLKYWFLFRELGFYENILLFAPYVPTKH